MGHVEVRIQLFGELRVDVDRIPVDVAELPTRARQLLELLALAPTHRLHRDQIVESLFGHLDAAAGTANLHKAASQARHQLGDRGAIVLAHGTVELWPSATVVTDLAELELGARAALAVGDTDACRQIAGILDAELLPQERYEDWLESDRRRLRGLTLDVLRAAAAWDEIVALDPADEAAHRELMRRHAEAGHRASIRDQFARLRHALGELGLQPGEETTRLFERLTRLPPVTAPLRTVGPFVGRRVELARGLAMWRQSAASRGGGLILRGEAGIGKTSLAEALLANAAAAGWTTMRGACARLDAALPYAPVAESVVGLVEGRPDLMARLPPVARSVLERMVGRVPADEAVDDQRVLSAVARLIAAAATERGVVLFLDDVHAADDDTLAVLRYLVRAATFQRVLILNAIRTDEETATVAHMRNDLLSGRRAIEIDLGPLSRAEAAELVAELQTGPDGPSPEILWERSGGNPYLLTELARHGVDRAHAVIAAQLERLDDAQRHLLLQLAVAGERVSAADLVLFAGGDDEAAGRLDAIVGTTLLERDHGDGYRFRHGLVREVLLERLPAHRRVEAHRTVAAALARAGAPPARVAHHYLSSDRPGQAADHLIAATRAAMRDGAYRNARAFADRALALRPDDPDVLALRADIGFATGEASAPLAYAAAVAAAPPDQQGPLRLRQARAHVATGDAAAAAAALAAAVVASPADVALRHLVEAQVAWMRGELDECARLVDDARVLGLTHGAVDVVFGAMSLRDLVAHQRGTLPERIRRDLLQAADSPVLAAVVHDAHLCGAETYLYGGRPYGEIKSFARQLAETSEHAGARRGQAFAVTLLGEAELLSGELAAAEDHLSRGVELHAEVGAIGGEALAQQRLAQVDLASGRSERARVRLARALPQARSDRHLGWHLVSRVYGTAIQAARTGDEAVSTVDEGEIAAGVGLARACPPCTIAFLLPAAIAVADTGDVDRARRFLAAAAPWIDALWTQGGWAAALDEARGHIAEAENDRASAVEHLLAASERFAAVGQPLDSLRCAAALAAMP
jgi:DNA-binding SARP family transcriptional activator